MVRESSVNPDPLNPRSPEAGIFFYGLLLVFVTWPRIQRVMGRALLPTALVLSSVAPIFERVANIEGRLDAGMSINQALADYWMPLFLLFVPLLLTAWQYRYRAVLFLAAATALLDLGATIPLVESEITDVAALRGCSSPVACCFAFVGLFVVKLLGEQKDARRSLATHSTTLEHLATSRERSRLARELHVRGEPMEVVKLLICDDQEVVREGLRAILGNLPGIDVVGVVGNGAEAVAAVPTLNHNVVLMDLNMPIKNGVQATRELAISHPQVKVLVLTTYDSEDWAVDAIRVGASGYLLKDAPREQLVAAIKGTAAGETHVDPTVAGNLFARVATAGGGDPTKVADDRSDRELDVLRLLGRELSNSEIAAQLFLSEGTVRNYSSAVLARLQVADRTQAAVLAVKNGLADQSSSLAVSCDS